MKIIFRVLVSVISVGIGSIVATSSSAQAIAPEKSAAAAATSDTRRIAVGIADNQNAMMLSQKATTRSQNARLRELAQQMVEDHTTMLYSLQELASAGGSSGQPLDSRDNSRQPAADLNNRLAAVSGSDFDTLWVSGMLNLQQPWYDDLVLAKGTVTNPQLKMAITEAIPLMRKHCSQLKALQKDLARSAALAKRQAAMHNLKPSR
jgi:putative membrane protein